MEVLAKHPLRSTNWNASVDHLALVEKLEVLCKDLVVKGMYGEERVDYMYIYIYIYISRIECNT